MSNAAVETTRTRFRYLSSHTLKCLGLNKAGVAKATFVVGGYTKDWRIPRRTIRRCKSLCELRAAFRDLSADATIVNVKVEVWWEGDTTPVRVWSP